MSLIPWLGGIAGVLLLTQLGSCSKMNDLREEIGEERQKCETRIAQFHVERLNELAKAEREADAARQEIIAELTHQKERLVEELHALRARNEETERELISAMRRVEQEDQEWADMPIPSYLLPQG